MRQREYNEQLISDGNCPLDGVPIKQHTRCHICGILIGTKHYEKAPHERSGKVYCSDCIGKGKS